MKQVDEVTKESLFDGLSLPEYVVAKKINCQNNHRQCKIGCKELCQVANMILYERYVVLSKVWRQVFPGVKYDCEKAHRRFGKMPVASIRFQNGYIPH